MGGPSDTLGMQLTDRPTPLTVRPYELLLTTDRNVVLTRPVSADRLDPIVTVHECLLNALFMIPRHLFFSPDVRFVVTVLLVVTVLVRLTTNVALYRGHALCLSMAILLVRPCMSQEGTFFPVMYIASLVRLLALATAFVSLECINNVVRIARHGFVSLILLLRMLLVVKVLIITLMALLLSDEMCADGSIRPNMTRPPVNFSAPVIHRVMETLKFEHLFLRRKFKLGRLVVMLTVTAGFRVRLPAIMETEALYVSAFNMAEVVYISVVTPCDRCDRCSTCVTSCDLIRIRVNVLGIRR